MAFRSQRPIDDGLSMAQSDMFANALAVCLLITAIIAAKVSEEKKEAEAQIQSPGNVIVEISWDAKRNVDLDLWVQGPKDRPVGYSSREGKVFNLLRDDLGHMNDSSEVNMENAFSRGVVEGEYVVNVHHFADHDRGGPIDVKVRVLVAKSGTSDKSKAEEILFTEFNIPVGVEQTAFVFDLTDKGELVDESVRADFHRNLYRSLRTSGAPGTNP